jgi:hypothetical protein
MRNRYPELSPKGKQTSKRGRLPLIAPGPGVQDAGDGVLLDQRHERVRSGAYLAFVELFVTRPREPDEQCLKTVDVASVLLRAPRGERQERA